MDGVGLSTDTYGNAFRNANTLNYDYLIDTYPNTKLEASGKFVGLPIGQMGNSEVGHMNIGTGRVIEEQLELINKSIADKSFFDNKEILKVINHVKQEKSKLHIMGLISDGGIHSHINHLLAILDMCKKNNVKNLYLHLFTDGRDTSPTSSYTYIKQVQAKLKEIHTGEIASISGRYYAMDRDNNYDRLFKAYDVIVNNNGKKQDNIKDYIEENYKNNITDEFLEPAKFTDHGNVEENDGIITFNFRRDRLRELFTAITNKDFKEMQVKRFDNLKVVTMFPVVDSVKAAHAFDNPDTKNSLGEYVASLGLSQLRIAETEKYAHVTFFFDGGKEIDYENEKKILIPSSKVATYDLKPEMSAYEITENLLAEIRKNKPDLIILNYANGDMVGHTGDYDAAISACEAVDDCLGKILENLDLEQYTLIVTADHGNCEVMINPDDSVNTAHTTNKVPFIVTDKSLELKSGKLADIAPTILKIMGQPIPKEMSGEVLIKE